MSENIVIRCDWCKKVLHDEGGTNPLREIMISSRYGSEFHYLVGKKAIKLDLKVGHFCPECFIKVFQETLEKLKEKMFNTKLENLDKEDKDEDEDMDKSVDFIKKAQQALSTLNPSSVSIPQPYTGTNIDDNTSLTSSGGI